MSELAACPFCGGPANGEGGAVDCPAEGCAGHFVDCTPEQWNRRANASAAVVEWPEKLPQHVRAAFLESMANHPDLYPNDNVLRADRCWHAMRAAHIAEREGK